MKKGMIAFALLGVFSWAAQGWADIVSLEPDSSVRIVGDPGPDGQPIEGHAVSVHLKNSAKDDILCNEVVLSVVLAGHNYHNFTGDEKLHAENIYISAGQEVALDDLGSQKNLESQGVLGVVAADIDLHQCHAANFADYCSYAAKPADEAYTVDQVLRATRRGCADAEKTAGDTLDLSGRNLHSLAPVGFLRNLTKLDLEKNKVDDLTPLAKLGRLQTLDVDENPVKDLSPALGLISIERIEANHTLVETLVDPHPGLHRKKIQVELDGTPYAKKH